MNPRRMSQEIKAFRFPGLFRPPRVQHFQDKSREPKGRARDLMKKTLCLDGDKISDLLVPPHPPHPHPPPYQGKCCFDHQEKNNKKEEMQTIRREGHKRGGWVFTGGRGRRVGVGGGGVLRQTIRH